MFGVFLSIFQANVYSEDKIDEYSVLRSGNTGLHSYASTSVLSSGKWVKIRVKETGVYKITYEDLSKMGFSTPAYVQIYGYGGWMQNENFLFPKTDDLPQLPVWVEKGSDGVFNAGDYILFYAKGPIKWSYTSTTNDKFTHVNNPYSNYGYYFITESSVPIKEMSVSQFEENASAQEITSFNDYVIHEKDLVNIGKIGREFYGEDFSYTTSQNFTLSTSGILNEPAYINVNFVAKAPAVTSVTVKINGSNTLTQSMSVSSSEYDRAKEVFVKGVWSEAKQESNTVNVTYGATGHSNSRLNYIRINYDKSLKPYGAYTPFRNVNTINKASKFIIANADQNVKIWNITDGENACQMEAKSSGSSIYFIANSPTLQEYIAVDLSKKAQFPSPEIVGEVKNQNLHALSQTDMVIISHPDFIEQANRIAELHREHDNLRVHVVSTDDVYNEFSSGTPDATAYRWLMKMFYDRGKLSGNNADLPKYLLLFGDGTFDNKLISDKWLTLEPANKILTFQSYNSLSEVSSAVIDDYFGFLDDDEGVNLLTDKVDIGIGRFPVRNITEAKNVTDKVINYVKKPIYGSWKSNLCFIGDAKGDDESSYFHTTQADDLATSVEKDNKDYIINKVYLSAFTKDVTTSGYYYPDANKKFKNLLQSGQLVVNYTGHGAPSGISKAKFYTKDDAKSLNVARLPLFITATCEYTRFDDYDTSAGEYVLLNPTGGGIALFSTTRTVYSDRNFTINEQFCKYLFTKGADGKYPRLGDVMMRAKRNVGDTTINKLAYLLFGDPALRLAYPEYKVEITSVNGESVPGDAQTFSAGAKVDLTGQISNPDGSKISDFSGLVYITMFDTKEILMQVDNKTLYDRSNVLYTGKESVTDGEFSVSFVVPKDMSYSYESGRINLYAADLNKNIEAKGYYENFIMGGTDPEGLTDNDPPKINHIYLNNPDFKSGDKVNASPVFFAEVEDESGINISGTGIGHDAVITIDNSPYEVYVLNSYFEVEAGSSGKGVFKFTIPTLSEGKHSLTFRVWDRMNNSTTQTFEFYVEKSLSPRIFDLYASPSPAKSTTYFYVTHDRPDANITVKIDVYSLSGAKLWSYEESGYSDTFTAVPIQWNLVTSSGSKLPPGVYIYKASISSDGSTEATESKKMIILAQ